MYLKPSSAKTLARFFLRPLELTEALEVVADRERLAFSHASNT